MMGPNGTEAMQPDAARGIAPAPETRGHAILRFMPLIVLGAAMIAVFATGTHRQLTLENVAAHRDWLQASVDAHQSKALAIYMLVYVAVVSLSIPGAALLTIIGGFLFGWLVGGAAAATAGTLGAIVIFSIARTSFGDILLRKAGPRLQNLAEGFRNDAFSYLLFLRVLPIVPFWLTNLAPALFGVRLRTFALATQIGVLPATFTFATTGAGLDSVIAAQQQGQKACLSAGNTQCPLDLDLGTLLTPELIAAFAALGLLSLVPVLVRRRMGKRLKGVDAGPAAP
jgi:uncharacterized membrane protein YdjX (TVP38/TMEM64 family)